MGLQLSSARCRVPSWPADAPDIDRRPALPLAVSSDRRVDPAIAVGRLTSDHLPISVSDSGSGCGRRPRRRGSSCLRHQIW